MNILRNYRNFINESIDSDKEVKDIDDIPVEVKETARKIVGDMFYRVKKPSFEITSEGIVMKFIVTDQDFNFIDENETLTLDVTEGAKRKRTYDVSLTFIDKVSETFEVSYLVTFEMLELLPDDDFDEDEEDVIVDDPYEREVDEDDFDEDVAEQQIRKGKIKLEDIEDIEDMEDMEDEY